MTSETSVCNETEATVSFNDVNTSLRARLYEHNASFTDQINVKLPALHI